jgi:hypothetical protein
MAKDGLNHFSGDGLWRIQKNGEKICRAILRQIITKKSRFLYARSAFAAERCAPSVYVRACPDAFTFIPYVSFFIVDVGVSRIDFSISFALGGIR